MTASRIIPFVLLVITTPACILSPDIVGETLTKGPITAASEATDSGTSTDSGSSTGPGPVTMTTVATKIDPTEGGQLMYGDFCQFGPPQVWEETDAPSDPDEPAKPQATLLDVNDQCAGGMCLLTYDHVLPPTCALDSECGPEGACDEG